MINECGEITEVFVSLEAQIDLKNQAEERKFE